MLWAKIRSLIHGLFRRSPMEQAMSEELEFHIEARAADLIAQRGLARDQALRQARLEFGSIEKYKDEGRQARGLRLFDELRADLRYAVRTLGRNRGFTIAAILTLALGIGANSAIFGLFEAILLRPMAIAQPERVVAIYTSDYSSTRYGSSSYPDYQDFLRRTTELAGIAAHRQTQLSMNAGSDTEMVLGEIVSGNYFTLLGVGAARGRILVEPDDRADIAPAAVISYDFWTRRFANDPGVVGRAVQFNGQAFTIAGVAARGFTGGMRPHSVDVWMTVFGSRVLSPARFTWIEERGSRGINILGRLRQGATIAKAQAEFNLIAAQQYKEYPDEWRNIRNAGRTISIVAERDTRVPPDFNGPVLGFMALLMTVVGLVLLTACANLANLLLARGAAAAREVGVRLALGAGRGRLIRQLLTENVLLSAAGGVFGLFVAGWLMRLLTSFKPPVAIPVSLDLRVNATVLMFTVGLSLLTGIIFGLVPALHAANVDLFPILKDNTSIGAPRRSRLARTFVIVQVAFSVLLLVGAGLFLRSLQNVTATDIGFDPANMIVMSVNPALQGYDQPRSRALYEKLLQHIATVPRVESASLAMTVPLGLMGSRRGTVVEGYQPQPGEDMEIGLNVVGPQYFETMRIPILRGRSFTEADRAGAVPVIIVNDTFARRYWPGMDPLGKRVSANGPRGPFRDVVGIVPTGKYNTLGEEPRPFYYVPLWQEYRGGVTLHVRTTGDPGTMLSSVREAIRSIDGIVPVFDAKTMDDQLLLTLLPARAAAILLGGFGILALLLAAVGVYGVMAYSVAQRTREIGVRLALGAQSPDVLRLVVGDGLRLISMGILFGGIAAAALTRLLTPLLYGITPYDPVAFAGAIAVLVGTALLACYLPARRAVRIDPVTALRLE
jgi:putative ABC transport system permease protein